MRYHNNSRHSGAREGGQQRPHREHRERREDRGPNNQTHHAILPPASVLQEYEYAAEGSVAKLLALAERELEHRHRFENKARAAEVLSYRLGQIAGLIMILFLIGAAVQLAEAGKDTLAATIAISGFFSLVVASSLNNRGRKGSGNRKFNNHRRGDRNNRNENRGERGGDRGGERRESRGEDRRGGRDHREHRERDNRDRDDRR